MLDPMVIVIALLAGLVARYAGLPPLIGYLGAGFLLHETSIEAGELLHVLSELGITLLLFTIGLKLQPAVLLKRQVWGTTLLHMALTQLFFLAVLLSASALSPALDLNVSTALVVAFALTFSSTVFVIQVMQAKGEMSSDHARQAIGILLIQDLAAVVFLAVTKGEMPDPAALLLLGLWPLRGIALRILARAGHAELFTLCGLGLALGGAALFEAVGIKGDLGALAVGAVLAGHQKSKELAHNLMLFKDLFLVCFFVSVGLDGWPSQQALVLAVVLGCLALLKTPLYFFIMTRLHTTPRTALLSATAMGNHSEFGLVVIAVAASAGWLDPQWTNTLSLAIATSFVLSSPLCQRAHRMYRNHHKYWQSHASDDVRARAHDTSGANVMVLGMGNIGCAAYDTLAEQYGEHILGVDLNPRKLASHLRQHRRVILADASDPDLWAGIELDEVQLVLLALTQHEENVLVGQLLREMGYRGRVAAVVRFEEEADALQAMGFSAFNLYAQAGAGFAEHAAQQIAAGVDIEQRA